MLLWFAYRYWVTNNRDEYRSEIEKDVKSVSIGNHWVLRKYLEGSKGIKYLRIEGFTAPSVRSVYPSWTIQYNKILRLDEDERGKLRAAQTDGVKPLSIEGWRGLIVKFVLRIQSTFTRPTFFTQYMPYILFVSSVFVAVYKSSFCLHWFP